MTTENIRLSLSEAPSFEGRWPIAWDHYFPDRGSKLRHTIIGQFLSNARRLQCLGTIGYAGPLLCRVLLPPPHQRGKILKESKSLLFSNMIQEEARKSRVVPVNYPSLLGASCIPLLGDTIISTPEIALAALAVAASEVVFYAEDDEAPLCVQLQVS